MYKFNFSQYLNSKLRLLTCATESEYREGLVVVGVVLQEKFDKSGLLA